MGKVFSVSIEPVYTAAIGCDPKISGIILNNAFDKIMAEAIGVGGIILKYGKPVSVVHIDAILCAKPHKALVVLQNAYYITLRKPIINAEVFKPYLLLLRKCNKTTARQDKDKQPHNNFHNE
jgi:hypothetical protein